MGSQSVCVLTMRWCRVDSTLQIRDGTRDLSTFVGMRPLRVLGKVVDIKAKVTQYLDETFYNLTAVATNDWKTYAEMRNLAQARYGLQPKP